MNDQMLEPAAEDLLRAGKKNVDHMSELPPLYSIAISLKRIADVLEGKPDKAGIADSIFDISRSIFGRG